MTGNGRHRGRLAPGRSKALKRYTDLLIQAALTEDIGSGDITTEAIVERNKRGEAVFLAKDDLVLAGLFIAEGVFKRLDKKTVFKAYRRDGEPVKKGEVFAAVSGRLSVLLAGERVALNFLQRLSGIATLTSEFVKRTKGTGVRILDTRKTTPCLRLLEKYAVRAGGGANHRTGLFDSILIKDNHIKAVGSVTEAVERVRERRGRHVRVEVETTSLDEVKEALIAEADVIMLDNMAPAMIGRAVRLIGKRALVEASGGVSLKTIGPIAMTGVDFISIGSLTHSARAVDISMEVEPLWNGRKTQRSR